MAFYISQPSSAGNVVTDTAADDDDRRDMPGWPNKKASHQRTTFSVDVLGAVGAANHPILRDAPVHLETHIAELPPLPILITRHTQGGGVPQLLVVLVFFEL